MQSHKLHNNIIYLQVIAMNLFVVIICPVQVVFPSSEGDVCIQWPF